MRLHSIFLTAALVAGCGGAKEQAQDQKGRSSAATTFADESGDFAGVPYAAVLATDEGSEILRYFKVGPIAVVQGDIDIGDHADLQAETLRNLRTLAGGVDAAALGLTPDEISRLQSAFPQSTKSSPFSPFGLGVGTDRLWPNRTLIYELGASLTDAGVKARLQSAIEIWNATGLVTMRAKTSSDTGRALVINSSSVLDGMDPNSFYCSARVGYVSAPRMHLSNVCGTYNIVHELGHALGLYHEHARQDRVGLITADMSKINADYKDQYDTMSAQYWNTSHDLCSMMHYSSKAGKKATTTGNAETWFTLTETGKQAFAQCAATLVNQGECGATAPGAPGQRCAISQTDRATIRAMYPQS